MTEKKRIAIVTIEKMVEQAARHLDQPPAQDRAQGPAQAAGEKMGEEITIQGWLYNQRESGKLLFPIFRDGTGILQGVVSQKEQPEAFAALRGLTQESSVVVTGRIRPEPRARS